MTRQKTIDDISLLGGHPALDFVNTVDSRGERWGPEFLNSYSDLVIWAGRLDVVSPDEQRILVSKAAILPAEAKQSLTLAKDLREALHRLFRAESSNTAVAEADLSVVDDLARRAQKQRTLVQTGTGIEWRNAVADTLDAIAGRVALVAAELLTSKQARRPVHVCEGQNCGWLFLDTSRNGHRRWCSDKTCGSHARVRKFRAERSNEVRARHIRR